MKGRLLLWLGVGFLGAMILAIGIGPTFLPNPNTIDPSAVLSPASRLHWLGTDQLGRDVFARVLVGGRVTLLVALVAALVSSGGGALFGMIAGWLGGPVDAIARGLIAAFLAVPRLPLMLLLISLGPGSPVLRLTFAMIAFGWMSEAMIARASVKQLRGQDFVVAAQQLGYPPSRILLWHLLPNLGSPLIVAATLSLGELVLYESVLSFLGLGIPPPSPSWGAMLAEGLSGSGRAPLLTIVPGMLAFSTIAAIQAVGDGLRDALDPKARRG